MNSEQNDLRLELLVKKSGHDLSVEEEAALEILQREADLNADLTHITCEDVLEEIMGHVEVSDFLDRADRGRRELREKCQGRVDGSTLHRL